MAAPSDRSGADSAAGAHCRHGGGRGRAWVAAASGAPTASERGHLAPSPAARSTLASHRLLAVMKSPFDVEDAKMDASGGSTPAVAVIDLEARPSALGSGLSQRLSALGQNLSHRISYLSHQMDDHGLSRISAVKVLTDDKDTVTEPGRGAWACIRGATLLPCSGGGGMRGGSAGMHERRWGAGEAGACALRHHDRMPQRHLALAGQALH